MGAAVLLVGIGVFAGCSNDVVDPDKVATDVLDTHFVPRNENSSTVATNPAVPKLDGERLDIEWGSADLNTIPWKAIRLDAENGSGYPGAPIYAFVKSVYTEKHLYFLVQWNDFTQSDRKDILTYVGPDFSRLPPGECYPQYIFDAQYWTRTNAEDWLSLAFEVDPAGDSGGSFSEQGCLVACHGGGFGSPGAGKLDVWHWLAARTNPPLILVNPNDSPVSPGEGVAGYADDLFADAGGLQPDAPDSFAAYAANFEGGGTRPRLIYRRIEGLCDPDNGGLTPKYAFMWKPCTATSFALVPCDTLNDAPVDQTVARKWRPGDTVAGYILQRPGGSRADVRAKGLWDSDDRVWTLEMSRALVTSDPERDVTFDVGRARNYRFTLAIADNSTGVHFGSEAQTLRFVPAR
jgi:hypothetical protein